MFHARTTHYIEYLAHEATFVPVEDWPLWRFRMDDYRRRWEKPDSWATANRRTLDWVRDELSARGPLRPVDLRDEIGAILDQLEVKPHRHMRGGNLFGCQEPLLQLRDGAVHERRDRRRIGCGGNSYLEHEQIPNVKRGDPQAAPDP